MTGPSPLNQKELDFSSLTNRDGQLEWNVTIPGSTVVDRGHYQLFGLYWNLVTSPDFYMLPIEVCLAMIFEKFVNDYLIRRVKY